MSTAKAETTFYHLDDCQMSGCPGHLMTAEFNTTSDSLQIRVPDMAQHDWSGDINAFSAMQDLFSKLDMENR